MPHSPHRFARLAATSALLASTACIALPANAQTQTVLGSGGPLDLATDSPFQDPNVVYLEADELVNDVETNTLTALGSVVGRYGDRELRAERVIYNLDNGEIFAEGNVTIVDSNGGAQFAEKVNLSNELQAGNATNFTLRTPEGGLTAAALAQQNPDGSIDLFNAYYTACEVCEDDPTPTWRIKARRVSQDKSKNAILYRDAVFEFLGVPVLYTPFFAHPDPSADRASGLLTPVVGFTNDKGAYARVPYFFDVDPYTNLTLTPRIYSGVNPALEMDFARAFATGSLRLNTSIAYGTAFDRDGDSLGDPALFFNSPKAPTDKGLRSHTFADGRFVPNDTLTYGFGVELTSDDLYLRNYDFDQTPNTRGLYDSRRRRLISQAYAVGQGDDWRVSASTFGFQNQSSTLRTRSTDGLFTFSESDNGRLPIVHPRIDAEKYFDVAGTRARVFGNGVFLTRGNGEDYARGTAGVEWSDTFIAPIGLEIEPFASARVDVISLDTNIDDEVTGERDTRDFTRALGYAGVDVRYPMIRPGKIDLIVEPRIQITQTLGDGKLENFSVSGDGEDFFSLAQDSLATDLDPTLLWDPNKSTGYDFWQEALRIDAGSSVAARWDANEASLFVGQSYVDSEDVLFEAASGLRNSTSDLVVEGNLRLGSQFRAETRLRYDDDNSSLRRIDSRAYLNLDKLDLGARYFRAEGALDEDVFDTDAPREEVSGSVSWRFHKNWRTSYRATYDIDSTQFKRQSVGLVFDDDCTRIGIAYRKTRRSGNSLIGGGGLAISVTLATLGSLD